MNYIFNEIEKTVYPGKQYTRDPDLKYLSNQGVLLINTAFTTTVNKIGTHLKLWQPFLSFLFDHLTFNKPDMVYAFLGKKAEEWGNSVPDNCYKFARMHPAAASHNSTNTWNSDDLFNKLNDSLEKLNKPKIVW